MRVLIAETDLFPSATAGGAAYCRLIERHRDLDFTYFRRHEPGDASRPENARTLPLKEVFSPDIYGDAWDIEPPRWLCERAFLEATNFAFSAAGQEFDVVDLPGWRLFGALLRPALRHHGVRYGRIAVLLEGSGEGQDGPGGDPSRDLLEQWQYRAADLRYGLSPAALAGRQQLFKLASHCLDPGGLLPEVYCLAAERDEELTAELDRWYERILRVHLDPQSRSSPRRLRRLGGQALASLGRRPADAQAGRREEAPVETQVWALYRLLFALPETSDGEIAAKLRIAWLERIRGHHALAALYLFRAMRALGEDRFGDLPAVAALLEHGGFPREAQTVRALLGPREEREARCLALIQQARADHRQNPAGDFELVRDHRPPGPFRVSVLVSLYNTGAKLGTFLRILARQTLVRKGQAEIILVDSGSPGDEVAAFGELMSVASLPAVLVRTARRETIQCAWNRALGLTRSPYVTCLGVDEALVPEGLEILAAALDGDPAVDWVQADAVVAEVDEGGSWKRDVLSYDRAGYRQDLVYLERCYLTWVAGLYRRSIHDRFGYYDPSFRAAGDTEFKFRVMPLIRSKAIAQPLGMYLNYPEERRTQSYLAEVEDIRAWHLWRSPAGIRYAFAQRSPEEVEQLFFDALGYRKSYQSRSSTDVDLARDLGDYLARVEPTSSVSGWARGLERLQASYRRLEWFEHFAPGVARSAFARARQTAAEVEDEHRTLASGRAEPRYRVFNDNRFQIESGVWLTDAESVPSRRGSRHEWR